MIISSFPCFPMSADNLCLAWETSKFHGQLCSFPRRPSSSDLVQKLKSVPRACVWNFVCSETPRPGTGGSHQPMVQPLQPVVGVPGWTSSPRGTNAVALRPAAPSAEGNRMKLGTPKPPPALSLCLCMSKVKLCKCSFERHSVGGSKMSVRQEGCLVFYQQCPEMCCGPPWIQCGEFTGTHSTW